jgi:exodeoxyribonuclease V alpha subunit
MPTMLKPKDVTAVEHVAKVERLVHENRESGFVIIKLRDGFSAMGTGTWEDLEGDVVYKFFGRWQDDAKHGYQFRFNTYIIQGFQSRSGCAKYLCDLCEGIGPATFGKLWLAYGANCVDVLRDEPWRVVEDLKLNKEMVEEACHELRRNQRFQDTKIDLNGLFAGRGFQGKLITKAIDKWGTKAPQFIRANPFRILNMPSAGFKRCDKLYIDLGLKPAALKRQVHCTLHQVRLDRNGHTWLDAELLSSKLEDAVPNARPRDAFRLGLRAGKLAKYRDPATNTLYITSAERAYAERLIAAHLMRLTRPRAGEALWPTHDIAVSKAEGDRLPSQHQLDNLIKATTGKVGILLGSPGTGKSHIVGYMLKAIVREFGREAVQLCAPTGKAAVRMTQAVRAAGVDLVASTIHSVLIACGAINLDKGNDNDELDAGEGFDYGSEDKPGCLECRFLIVDEMSMTDTTLMAVLLSAMPTEGHILFVGDTHQLPPVGHGSPLRDLVTAGVPHGELTHVRRNAGQIVHACLRIKNGEEFESADRVDLDANPPKNLKLIPAKDDEDIKDVLFSILRNMKSFHPVWSTQIIISRNKGGMLTRKPLNEALQGLLNPDGRMVSGNPFRTGDKIICLKNSKQTVVALHPSIQGDDAEAMNPDNYGTVQDQSKWNDPNNDGRSQAKQICVANGEIGRVIAVGPKHTIARFSEGDDVIRITMAKGGKDDAKDEDADTEGRGCHFDLAYAITCHKAQGSQAPCVILLADASAGGVCTREWWYTAVSRAEKVCMIVGQKSVIEKQAARVSTAKRKTFLVEQIQQLREQLKPTADEWAKSD